MPALSRWGGATVGLTLLAIGAMGLYEIFFDAHDDDAHPESDPAAEALTGGWVDGVCVCLCVGRGEKGEKERVWAAAWLKGVGRPEPGLELHHGVAVASGIFTQSA